MIHCRMFVAPPSALLRLLAVAAAALLILLACEGTGEEPLDPADVVDSFADQLLTCFSYKPCPSHLVCVAGVCLKTGDGAIAASSDAGASGATTWAGGTPKGIELQSSKTVPCSSPIGLAWDGIYLWCADANGNMARRFLPGQSSATANIGLPSGGTNDIGFSGVSNRINASSGDGNVWQLGTTGGTQAVFSAGAVPGISLNWDTNEILTIEGTNQLVRRQNSSYVSTKVTTLESSGSNCQRLAWSHNMAFRWCGTSGSGANRQQRVAVFTGNTAPNANWVQELKPLMDASGNGGIEVSGSRLWLIGIGSGTSVGRILEFQLY